MLILPRRFYKTLLKPVTKCFSSLKTKGKVDEKQLKYFTYEYKQTCNLGKLFLLPKIHKRLHDVPGRPVISNCGTPTEKVSEFLDMQLKPIMQKSWSYSKNSGNFIREIKNLTDIPEGAILVAADVVSSYPSIPHETGLEALKKALDEREDYFHRQYSENGRIFFEKQLFSV